MLVEGSEKGRAVMAVYGSFPAILYWRIKKQKIFPTSVENFMEEFVGFFFHNAPTVGSSAHALGKVKSLAGAIPTVSSIKSLLKYHRFNTKNAIFFKLSIDILACYYMATGSPLFKTYKEEVIPMALLIYKALPQNTLQDVFEHLSPYYTKSKLLDHKRVESKQYLVLYKTKEEYLAHYKNEGLEYDNLTAGNTIHTFYI